MSLYSRCFWILLLSVIFSFSAFSITKTWTGNGADNKFTTAANWAENLPAAIGDDLIFPAVATQYSVDNDILMFPGSLNSYRTITIENGGYTFGGTNSYNLSNGIILNGGNQTLTNCAIFGTVFVNSGASLNLSSLSMRFSGFTIDGGGNLTITSAPGTTANSYIKNGTGTTNFNWGGANIQQLTVNSGKLIGQGILFPSSPQGLRSLQVNGGIVEGSFGVILSATFDGPNAEFKPSALILTALGINILNGAKFSPEVCSSVVTSPASNYMSLGLTNAVFNPQFTNCTANINNLFHSGIATSSPVTGFFTNYPEGSTLNIGGKTYRMTYRGGDGNDVQLIKVNYPNDFDGDSKSDVSVFRSSNNYWYLQQSSTGFTSITFGTSGDIITPADYTGDSKTDIAVFRPSNGFWYVLRSEDNTFYGIPFGTLGDIPVSTDYTGDGKADLTVYRPSNGTWYRLNSENNSFYSTPFGISEDKPTVGDFDGDGKSDIAVFRPSNGFWYRLNSTNNSFFAVQFGQSGDKVVPADYTGDGKTDIAVYRGGNWYILRSEDLSFYGLSFGIVTDIPSPADYDGDGKSDFTVYRNGNWYLLKSTNGFSAIPFGLTNDIPIPSSFFY